MNDVNGLCKALGAGLVSVAVLAGCAGAKTVPEDVAESEPATPAGELVPAAELIAEVESTESEPESTDHIHVVAAGEHLWGIAGYTHIYNDPYQWPAIFKRNRAQINDADLIYPGQELVIQRDLTEDQIQRAIDHARTRGAWSLGPTEESDLDYLSGAD